MTAGYSGVCSESVQKYGVASRTKIVWQTSQTRAGRRCGPLLTVLPRQSTQKIWPQCRQWCCIHTTTSTVAPRANMYVVLKVLTVSKNYTSLNNNNNNCFMALCPALPGWAGTRRNTHPPTILIIVNLYQLLPSTTINSILPVQITCLAIFFAQPHSMSSLVYLLVWSPPPHIPYISSPNQCFLFAQYSAYLQYHYRRAAGVLLLSVHTQPFMAPFLGLPGWASARRNLLDFYGARKDNTGRYTDHPGGRNSIWTNQRPTSVIHPFLRRMLFLLQPSHFILAWDRHQIC